MKIKRKNQSKLDAIGRAVKKGLPLAGITVAAILNGCEKWKPQVVGDMPRPEERRESDTVVGKMTGPETVSIDVMSLYHRRFSTPGIMYPEPLTFVVRPHVVAEGDTWESLAKKHKVTLEIMLRINGVQPEKVYAILDDGGKIPPELALKAGKKIKVPVREVK